jgi:hypothetical protein
MGVTFDTVENEAYSYFIGVFEDIDVAERKRDELRLKERNTRRLCPKEMYFIKKVEKNESYTFRFTNDCYSDTM